MFSFTISQDFNYKMHSIFVFHFTKYIEWPENKKVGDFSIGIIGNSPIFSELEKMAQTKKVGSQTIIIKKINILKDVSDCHIVFISSSKSSELEKVMSLIDDKPVLIISEKNGLCNKGSAVNFVIIDDKLKFEVNKTNIESHGLKVSVVLLELGVLPSK